MTTNESKPAMHGLDTICECGCGFTLGLHPTDNMAGIYNGWHVTDEETGKVPYVGLRRHAPDYVAANADYVMTDAQVAYLAG